MCGWLRGSPWTEGSFSSCQQVRNTHMGDESCGSHRTLHSQHLHSRVNNSLDRSLWLFIVSRLYERWLKARLTITHIALTTSCLTWVPRPACKSLHEFLSLWVTNTECWLINCDWCCGHFRRLCLVCCVFWGFLQMMPPWNWLWEFFRLLYPRGPVNGLWDVIGWVIRMW